MNKLSSSVEPTATHSAGVRLLVVGGGQMGRALVGGILARGVLEPCQITILEPNEKENVTEVVLRSSPQNFPRHVFFARSR